MAYFSNNSDPNSWRFDSQCMSCPLADKGCTIAAAQMIYNYDQCDNEQLKEALELLVSTEKGCRIFPLLKELGVVEE